MNAHRIHANAFTVASRSPCGVVWCGVVWLSAVGARKLHGGFVALCCAQHGACSSTSCRARFVFAS